MTPFQIAIIGLSVGLCVWSLVRSIRGETPRRDAMLWCLLWVLVGAAVTWPKAIVSIARTVGIGRGADLVLYTFVFVSMIGFLMTYSRLQRLRREMTLLVRHFAIRDAHVAPPGGVQPAPSIIQAPSADSRGIE